MPIRRRTGMNNPGKHIIGKAFAFGSGMHQPIHCFGSNFIFFMVYFLS
jgi:hypothetical protein